MKTRTLTVGLFVLGWACGGGDDGGDGDIDAGVSQSCMEATTQSTLPEIQENIFTPSCASFSVCHMGAATTADGLNLEDGMTMANVVGVPSDQVATVNLIEPGDPANSYLLIKLGRGQFPPGADTDTMPLANPLLCDEKIDAVVRWVNSL